MVKAQRKKYQYSRRKSYLLLGIEETWLPFGIYDCWLLQRTQDFRAELVYIFFKDMFQNRFFFFFFYVPERKFLLSNRHLNHFDETCPTNDLMGTREGLHRCPVQGTDHALEEKRRRRVVVKLYYTYILVQAFYIRFSREFLKP